MGQYYDAIAATDEVLKRDPTNDKALFRRAKAEIAVWNLEDVNFNLFFFSGYIQVLRSII